MLLRLCDCVFSADHEDQDVMMFNRITLPAYYGLLRMCCQQSRVFTRQLAQHQNILWAFKNITPYPGQYPGVCFRFDFDNILNEGAYLTLKSILYQALKCTCMNLMSLHIHYP